MIQYDDQILDGAGPSGSGWGNRLCRWFGLLGLSAISILPVAAQTPAVPQHWISYAQLAGNQFQTWLSDPASETVVHLYASLEKHLTEQGLSALPSVVARVWVTASGRIERLEFESLGNKADADLRAILMARSLFKPPPPDMRQPMVLQLSLEAMAPL